MKLPRFALPVLLALAASALARPAHADYVIHIRHPWADDTARSRQPVHFIAPTVAGAAYPGVPMRAEAATPWHSHVLKGAYPPNTGFFFSSYLPTPQNPTANGVSYFKGGNQFLLADIPFGKSEIWILPQGTGAPLILDEAPVLPGDKVAWVLNPWPITAPLGRIGTDTVFHTLPKSRDRDRCGWYRILLPGSVRTVLLKEAFGTGVFGRDGLGSAVPLDLTAAFAASDTAFILPADIAATAPSIKTSFPTTHTGTCTFMMAMTVRDFSKEHPDFEVGGTIGSDMPYKGMVASTLGSDGKPVQGPSPQPKAQSAFTTWFNTDTTGASPELRNRAACRDLPLSKASDGRWSFDSYDSPSRSFFPIDDFNPFAETYKSQYEDRKTGAFPYDPTGADHNFHFCLELHAEFEYQAGRDFNVSGDDDIWVFVDGKLALDLGGVHTTASGSLPLGSLGLVPGKTYPLDFFYCERQTNGSNLRLSTNLYLTQVPPYLVKVGPLAGNAVLIRPFGRTAPPGECVSGYSGTEKPVRSEVRLYRPFVRDPVLLTGGASFGGIAFDSLKAEVVLDTSKLVGLDPGRHVLLFMPEGGGPTAQVAFTVPGPVASNPRRVSDKGWTALFSRDHLRIRLPEGVRSGVVSIHGLDGRVLLHRAFDTQAGRELSIPRSAVGRGVRLISLMAGGRTTARPILCD